MAVHQLVPSFVPGDAMGQAALHLQLLARRLGHHGEIFAGEIAPGYQSLVRPARELRPRSDDLVLYHHGIASPWSGALLHLPCRRGVVFHNVTPARLYPDGPLKEALVSGRAQLAAMAAHVELAIGVSEYNAAELVEAGYRNVHVVPLFVEPERFSLERADPGWLRRLAQGGPAMLSVSRVVPHKRTEDLLALHRELRRLRSDARLLVVGGFEPGGRYFRELHREAEAIGQVEFLGRVEHAQLVAAYRAARVFVSMSEHEGFGVPLVEAMAAELPVLAYGATAVPETLGGRGIQFTEKRFALLAELVNQLFDDAELRRRVIAGQAKRLRELSSEAAAQRLSAVLPRRTKARMRRRSRPRVGIVVQRYGEVGGGAEAHARQIAHRLAPYWDVTVLTTCAADHLTWENAFAAGASEDGPVQVLRFPTVRSRDMRSFNQLSRTAFAQRSDRLAEERWLAEQGPLAPELLAHLADHRDHYDGFVVFTYLYAPTAWGLPLIADKALVVPTAHDEPPLGFGVFADVFERPRALLCNTPEELSLIARRFPNHARARVVGVGVELPPGDGARFRERHQLAGPYLLYVGRIEEGKGIGELLAHHRQLTERYYDAPTLVLAGTASMRVRGANVRYLGRISEQDKLDGLAGALAAVVPSRFESLSLLALEAFAQGTPVLANSASEVLVGQVERSGAGATYCDAASFAQEVRRLGEQRQALSGHARRFARRHSWARVIAAYREEMRRIMEERR